MYDYALVGGGLQNGLIALALRARQPGARVAMIERGEAVGGNHTWCFHASDITAADASWIEPLVVARWPGYDVAFAELVRRLEMPYACVSSARLSERVGEALAVPGCVLFTRTSASAVSASTVDICLPSGAHTTIHARVVIDARGPHRLHASGGGWQTFLGQELELAEPHGLERPMLIDARGPQRGGFRFFYVLPLAEDRVLVEDTCFGDTADLDGATSRAAIARYVAARGWRVRRFVREELGALPMPLTVAAPATQPPLVAGYAGGWFHPTTAYSFPVAARLAAHVASRPADQLFGAELDAFAHAHARQLAFATRLNRMLFRWFAPEDRHHVLARFYRLPEAVIARFYALELSAFDRARFFLGRPPRGMSLRAAFGGAR